MAPGDMAAVVLVAVATLLALAPLRRPRPLASASFWLTMALNELPAIAFAYLAIATVPTLIEGDLGWPTAVLAAATSAGLVAIGRRGIAARRVVEAAVRGLGDGQVPDRSVARTLLAPFPMRPRAVARIANVSYGDGGRHHRLDLYSGRAPSAGCPVLVHFHGGHFRMGGKSREARALFHTLAAAGWLCASANYRLKAAGRFPASLIDAKRAIAWLRAHAADYGGDPSTLVVAGSSAGAHLAAMAALTPDDPGLQPGFERADTGVSAAVCLYGYYGSRTSAGPRASTPQAYAGPHAPPFLIAHGTHDTIVEVQGARRFSEELRGASSNPVVYIELPGAQHGFDLFRSPRFQAVVDAVSAFNATVRAR